MVASVLTDRLFQLIGIPLILTMVTSSLAILSSKESSLSLDFLLDRLLLGIELCLQGLTLNLALVVSRTTDAVSSSSEPEDIAEHISNSIAVFSGILAIQVLMLVIVAMIVRFVEAERSLGSKVARFLLSNVVGILAIMLAALGWRLP